jgi:hypothetical protein
VSRRANILKKVRSRIPQGLHSAVPAPVKAWLREEGPALISGAAPGAARKLEARLWGGFSTTALAEIDIAVAAAEFRPRDAAEALLVRARWRAARAEIDAALADTRAARSLRSALARNPRQFMLEAQCLCALGKGAEARALLDLQGGRGLDVSATLLLANSWNPVLAGEAGSESGMLAAIDDVFSRFGLAGIRRRDAARPLTMDNIVCDPPVAAVEGGQLVTVIMPLHNGATTLTCALESLAAQSWRRIEVLIVDDASADGGAAVAAAFCARDPRFRLMRQSTNGGSYVARNRALGEAAGEFVTVHDADDWSHPDKIRLQIDTLRDGAATFSLSAYARAGTGLDFQGPWRPSPRLVARNFSSLLAPRDLLRRAGGWDPVRFGADSELIRRLGRLFGEASIATTLSECPLSFGRTGSASLTGAGPSHLSTFVHGLRREYHETRSVWHAGLEPGGVPAPEDFPPEAVTPPALRPVRTPRPPVDVLIVDDLNRPTSTELPDAARGAGLTVALTHYPDASGDVTLPVGADLRRFAHEAGISLICPGERLTATVVLVMLPDALAHVMDRFPEVSRRHLVVAIDRAPKDPPATRAGLRDIFGEDGLWVPVSAEGAAWMRSDPDCPETFAIPDGLLPELLSMLAGGRAA